jgi:hypothetical protein
MHHDDPYVKHNFVHTAAPPKGGDGHREDYSKSGMNPRDRHRTQPVGSRIEPAILGRKLSEVSGSGQSNCRNRSEIQGLAGIGMNAHGAVSNRSPPKTSPCCYARSGQCDLFGSDVRQEAGAPKEEMLTTSLSDPFQNKGRVAPIGPPPRPRN